MGRFAGARWVWWVALAASVGVGGCANSSLALKNDVATLQQQQLALQRQTHELQGRAGTLSNTNEEQIKMLAQFRQQAQILTEHNQMLQEELGTTTAQLAEMRSARETAENKTEALMASMQRRGSVTIEPNNSFITTLPGRDIPEIYVREDGDTIRIAIPENQIFQPRTNTFVAGGQELLVRVADEVVRSYSRHRIGIEVHTDKSPIQPGSWHNHHHLTVTQAMAVSEVLATQTQIRPDQVWLVGHGANIPAPANAPTAAGRQDARIELVIYPDRLSQ